MKRRASRRPGVVGLDMSLTSPAAAFVPRDWTGDASAVIVAGWPDPDFPKGATHEQKADRWERISRAVVAFCEKHQPVLVGVEDYAFSRKSSSVTRLAELGGIIRIDLRRARPEWLPHVITASQARKVLLQHVPQSGAKEWTQANVRRLKGDALYWSEDEVDAVVVANFVAQLAGWVPLSFPGEDV